MIKIKQAIIVEGKYDKIKLSSLVDATIIETNGFRIFKNKEKLDMIRLLADRVGLVILTDSDSAGFKIRRYLGGSIPKEKIINAYIPDIYGKEHRKAHASAEGKLGVEGVPAQVLLEALERAGVTGGEEVPEPARPITKLDFYEDGLTGGENSSQRRAKLLALTHLPEHLTTNSMITIFNTMMDYDTYRSLVDQL